MRTYSIPAIYEDGVLKPLVPLDLAEHQQVYLSLDTPDTPTPGDLPSLTHVRRVLREALVTLAPRYAIRSLGLFGSYARGEQRPDSDLDLLIEFSQTPGFLAFIQLEQALAEAVGLPIDLVTVDALKPALRETILAEIVPV